MCAPLKFSEICVIPFHFLNSIFQRKCLNLNKIEVIRYFFLSNLGFCDLRNLWGLYIYLAVLGLSCGKEIFVYLKAAKIFLLQENLLREFYSLSF